LRIGTTASNGWEWTGVGAPIMMEVGPASSTADTTEAPTSLSTESPVPMNTWAPATSTGDNSSVPINSLPPRTWSLTTNYITTLKMSGGNSSGDGAGEMKKLGELQLGKMDETFTSIRFFDDVAYAITFLQKDPMYVLDLSDPSNPRILGELDNITGFSNYLHPMDDSNTMLLGVGQDTDENGNVVGLMISVFDATDPANPQLLKRHVVEKDPDTWSSSDATWDFYAIRYERTTQQLIIPMSISNWNKPQKSFNGFSVYKVNEDAIKEKCRIEHGNYYANYNSCYYCTYLPSRSFIFEGDVMTVNSQFVRMTDTDTCKGVWDFEMSLQDPNGQCCSYQYYW
jgi:hypothetical protein